MELVGYTEAITFKHPASSFQTPILLSSRRGALGAWEAGAQAPSVSPCSLVLSSLAGHAGLGTCPSRMRLLGQQRCWSFSECLYLAPTHPDTHAHTPPHMYTCTYTPLILRKLQRKKLPAGRSSLSLRDFLIRQFRTMVHVQHEINHRDFTFRQTPFSRRPVGRGLCVH